MGYNLFLDDIRQPFEVGNYINPVQLREQYRKEEWVIVRKYEEFIECIELNGIPDKVSFDHDLADIHYNPITHTELFKFYEKTGLDCAEWLVEYCKENKIPLPKWFVHSMNPVGAENIKDLLNHNS